MHDIGNFHGKKLPANIAFPHFLGTAVADVKGTSHLLITGETDFTLIGLTQDTVFQLRLLKRTTGLKLKVKQAVMQWHTDIYALLEFHTTAMFRVHSQ